MEQGLFGEVAEQWLTSAKKELKRSSVVRYANLLNVYICPWLGETCIGCMTHSVLQSFCEDLLEKGGANGSGLSQRTVSDSLSVVRMVLRFARTKGYEVPYLVQPIRIPREPKPMRVLDLQEQQRLCAYLVQNPDRKNIGILLCLFTGIRLGELCALKWEDISFDTRTIRIQKTMQRLQTEEGREGSRGTKTGIIVDAPSGGASVRTIPLPDELALILEDCCGNSKGYLLTGSEEKYVEPRTMQNCIKRVAKHCFLEDVNYRVLRNTFAIRCTELGFEPNALSAVLGYTTTVRLAGLYARPSAEQTRRNMQKQNRLLWKGRSEVLA